MLYHTCSTIPSVDLAYYEVFRAKDLGNLEMCYKSIYSLIQMKCQGGNKYALSITVKFDQSTTRFGRISFARLFKLTKHIVLLFISCHHIYCLVYMRGSRNVRKNMHIIKTIMKFCAHRSTVCGMMNSDTREMQTQ